MTETATGQPAKPARNLRKRSLQAVVAVIVVVTASILYLNFGPGAAFEKKEIGEREAFCQAIGFNLVDTLESIRTSNPDEHRTKADTVLGFYADPFVNGAPGDLRSAAEALRDDLGTYLNGPEPTGPVPESIGAGLQQLQRDRSGNCPG